MAASRVLLCIIGRNLKYNGAFSLASKTCFAKTHGRGFKTLLYHTRLFRVYNERHGQPMCADIYLGVGRKLREEENTCGDSHTSSSDQQA